MAEEASKNEGKLWSIFSSMKTGLAILGIIVFVSGIGTLIPQEAQEPDKAEAVANIWKTLGFTHVFSTPWFRLILGLLCLNLIICSINRFNGIMKLTFRPRIPMKAGNVPTKNRVEFSGQFDSLSQVVKETLKDKSYQLFTEDNGETWGFYGLKHRWGYWGSLITHLAFVILVLGALIGTMLGFKGYLTAGEGNMVPIKTIQVNKGKVTKDFSVYINSAQDRILANGERDNWYTDISILDKGKEVIRQEISVNHPLTYQGITFYQSSFFNAAKLSAELKEQKIPIVLRNQGEDYYQAPGTDLYLIVADMSGDNRNPGILFQVYKADGQKPIQSGQLSPGQVADIQGQYKITFEGYTGYTGLQVKADPGVWVIWLGCLLLVVGMMLAFYWQPIVVSGIITKNGLLGQLTFGAPSGKYATKVKAEFENLVKIIKENSKQGE